jgi:hypothetical protein
MNDLRSWLARLTMVGLCMAWIGCGGSDVPDPGADAQASNDAAPAAVDSAPAAPAAKDEAEVVAKNDAPAPAASADAPAPAAEDKPAEEKPAAAVKGDSSGTTELFNLANNAPPPPDVAAPADAAAPTPGGPGGPGGPRSMGGPGMMQPGMSPGQMAGGPPDPRTMGGSVMRGPGGMAGMPGMQPGGRGGPGMGMSGADNAPADYTLPIGAVTAFLNAVKAKDKDRIAEATALRSTTEAHSDGMKKLFAKILDQSVSDDDVAEMAKQLEGYTIIGMNDALSSGRQGIILGKASRNTQIRRTITVRHEAKGWKVVDISGQSDVMGTGSGRSGTKSGVRPR